MLVDELIDIRNRLTTLILWTMKEDDKYVEDKLKRIRKMIDETLAVVDEFK